MGTWRKMPVHSLLVTNGQGMLLYSKYFDHTISVEERAAWERTVYRHSKNQWRDAESRPQFFVVREEIFVVYRATNDWIVFLAGSDECDEPVLSELVGVVLNLISSACDKKTTEKSLLEGDAYGKFSVLVDQMMPQGIIEHVDIDMLEKLAKLKTST